MGPAITAIECIEFDYPMQDVGTDRNGFNLVYDPGEVSYRRLVAIRIRTDTGVTGQYVGRSPGSSIAQLRQFGDYLIGEDPLHRERHWSEIKRALRQYDKVGLALVDVGLWDLAGRYHDVPIHELIGTYRTRLPAYASTPHGDENGGLDTPEAFADFAERCSELGYPAFKIHGWGGSDEARDTGREIETIQAVGERVGDRMDLMVDPACEYETFGDALKVGRACDEQDLFWYEDPYRDTGTSQHGHRKLREALDTPLLQTELVRGLEPHTDFVAADATDFVRADPDFDGGITGCLKIAHATEGFGLDVEYHAPGPAKRHLMAATRNTNYYEMGLVHPAMDNLLHPPIYEGGYEDSLTAIDQGGTVGVPSGPGLGVEYDWDYIEDNEQRTVTID